MRFRIRDGESDLIQLGEEEGEGESSKGKTDNDNNGVVGEDGDKRDVVRDGDEEILSRVSMERDKGEESTDLYDPISSVPDIFFRPYFDLTGAYQEGSHCHERQSIIAAVIGSCGGG